MIYIGYDGLPFIDKPRNELDPLQIALLEIQDSLGSQLNASQFSLLMGERRIAHAWHVRQLIHDGINGAAAGGPLIAAANDVLTKVQAGDQSLVDRLSTNLVSIDGLPEIDEWLTKLCLKSRNSAAHAISEATGVNYHTIDSYFQNRPDYQIYMIRKEVRDCILDWLTMAERGGALAINPNYRGIRKDIVLPEMLSTMKFLIANKVYRSKRHFVETLQPSGYSYSNIANKFLARNSNTNNMPMHFYLFYRYLFSPYMGTGSYGEGDVLTIFSDNWGLTPAKDVGIVEERVSSRMMHVRWKNKGKQKMPQDGPYMTYKPHLSYEVGDKLYNPSIREYGIVVRVLNEKLISVSCGDRRPIQLPQRFKPPPGSTSLYSVGVAEREILRTEKGR